MTLGRTYSKDKDKKGGRFGLRTLVLLTGMMAGYLFTTGYLPTLEQDAEAAPFRSLASALTNPDGNWNLVQVADRQQLKPAGIRTASARQAADTMPDYIPDPPPPSDAKYQVQAVLVAKSSAIFAAPLDGRLSKFPFKSGDSFKKGDILAEFDCGMDRAKLREIGARAVITDKQLIAYKQLRELGTVSEMELVTAQENHAQNLAIASQMRERLKSCKVVAPFDGRVSHRMVNPHEFVQTGRVMMDVSSREPLQAEFLVPSIWLRWLNVGTPLSVYIEESGKRYDANIVRVSGEVDPVSQSVQVAAEVSKYHEELLPGMSGRATFDFGNAEPEAKMGYLGLILDEQPATAPPPEVTPEKAPRKKR
ncbi:MAG: efflux RND transporter periplasmic adaptor subunit [Alphaproteobacteria bacterium]